MSFLHPADTDRAARAVAARTAKIFPDGDADFLVAVQRSNPFGTRGHNLTAQHRLRRLNPSLATSLERTAH